MKKKPIILLCCLALVVYLAHLGLKEYKLRIIAKIEKKISYYQHSSAETSSVPIEVVLVTAEKDFVMLPYAVESIRKNIKQPITKITLVSPKSETSVNLAKRLDIHFVDENSLLELKQLKIWINQSGIKLRNSPTWYYQQFLKLLYHKISKEKHYFVMDADIVLTKPMILVSDYGINTFFVGHNMGHESYKLSVQKLLGNEQFVPEFSFVADMMCFNKDVVADMLQDIEKRFEVDWYKAALLVQKDSDATFSEFELYGSYFHFNQKYKKNISSFFKTSDAMLQRQNIEKDINDLRFKFVPYIAFHHWLNNT